MDAQDVCDFDYSSVPLSTSSDHIRLLKLSEASRADETLAIELAVFPLAKIPAYAAISYVWGDATQKVPVMCNDLGNIRITKNLYDLLSRLADEAPGPDQWEYLWADSICINQSDLEERRTQVLLMQRIYGQADATFIWLSHEDEKSREAWDFAMDLSAVRTRCEAANDDRFFFQMNSNERHQYGIPDQYSIWARNLSLFLLSGWFSRVWVIQELALSKRPIILTKTSVGVKRHDWETFSIGAIFASRVRPAILPGIFRLKFLVDIRAAVRDKDLYPLIGLLVLCRGFDSTDPRDKIYAFLGISSDSKAGDLDIQPDYTVPQDLLLCKVAAAMLLRDPRLRLLQESHDVQDPYRPALPSWVPDWKYPAPGKPPYSSLGLIQEILTGEGEVSTTYAATPAAGIQAGDISDDFRLRLAGIAIGSIQTVGISVDKLGATHESSPSSDMRSAFKYMTGAYASNMTQVIALNNWAEMCNVESNQRYAHTGETTKGVYCQTITAGYSGEGAFSPEAIERGYQEFHRLYQKPNAILRSSSSLLVGYRVALALWKTPARARSDKQLEHDYRAFLAALGLTFGRRMFRTKEEYIGLGPSGMKTEDQVFLIKGCATPLVLRAAERQNEWRLIGACYLHGVMNGEKYDEDQCRELWLV